VYSISCKPSELPLKRLFLWPLPDIANFFPGVGNVVTGLNVSEKQKTEKLNYLWIYFFYRRRFG